MRALRSCSYLFRGNLVSQGQSFAERLMTVLSAFFTPCVHVPRPDPAGSCGQPAFRVAARALQPQRRSTFHWTLWPSLVLLDFELLRPFVARAHAETRAHHLKKVTRLFRSFRSHFFQPPERPHQRAADDSFRSFAPSALSLAPSHACPLSVPLPHAISRPRRPFLPSARVEGREIAATGWYAGGISITRRHALPPRRPEKSRRISR